ncbi:MAG: HD domain-containing protein [Myxococcales bacterium]|nr:HD domain-containing protein [Myxococcales bacterium]
MSKQAAMERQQPSDAEDSVEAARYALEWAVRVATEAPEALDAPPPRPTREALKAIAVPELRKGLDSLLLGRHTQDGLDALLHAGVLDAWLPEVKALVGFGDGEWRHKDVWKHTKQVVWQSVPRLEVRWGALLHDVGKVKTRRIEPGGQVHFFGHSEVGAAMFRRRISSRLGFEDALHDRVHYLILYHLRASQYDRSWTDSAVRRFDREMGDGLKDLLDLSRADITTKRPERRKRGLRQISELAQRIEQLRLADAKVAPLPKGVGDAMMAHFAMPPSRRIGDLKRRLTAEVEAGALEPGRDSEYYVAWLEAHRDELGL